MSLQKVLFSIGIAIVLALFINVAFSLVYERPAYPEQSECYPKFVDGGDIPVSAQQQAVCDAELDAFEDASKAYSLVFFIFSIFVGVALLAGGIYLSKNEAFSWGIMFAGLFQLIFGSAQYWGELNKVLRLVLLGAALVVLWFIAKKAGWNK